MMILLPPAGAAVLAAAARAALPPSSSASRRRMAAAWQRLLACMYMLHAPAGRSHAHTTFLRILRRPSAALSYVFSPA